MKNYFIFIPFLILVSCGNPIIEDEYGKVFGLGDNKLYIIKTDADISKLHAHPDGTFIFDLDDDIEMDAMLPEFSGKMQGMGPGRVLVSGMMFGETNGAVIKDMVFLQNSSPDRGVNVVGLVTGVARNTQFINVRIEGGQIATVRTGGMEVFVGGIAGQMDAGSVITRSSSEAGVAAGGGNIINIGGLVGYNNGGVISYSYSHGAITGSAEDTMNAGGLAGLNTGKIFDSYYALAGGIMAAGATTNNVGGLVGDSSAGIIENSYSSTGAGGNYAGSGLEPASPEKVYHNKTSFVVGDFSSNPSYWSFDATFQDGDVGGTVTPGSSVTILPRLVNNPDRFSGPWR